MNATEQKTPHAAAAFGELATATHGAGEMSGCTACTVAPKQRMPLELAIGGVVDALGCSDRNRTPTSNDVIDQRKAYASDPRRILAGASKLNERLKNLCCGFHLSKSYEMDVSTILHIVRPSRKTFCRILTP